MIRMLAQYVRLCVAALTLAGVVACNGSRREPPPEPPPTFARSIDAALEGTIGAKTLLANVEGQVVRGFGLVWGLGENGSSDCPTVIREYLVEAMSKESESWGSLERRRKFSPGDLIDSRETAVVDVIGIVPAGSRPGTQFDVEVRAIPGTSTRSLAGGLLLPCELRLPDITGSYEDVIGAAAVARAAGPVFVNPVGGDPLLASQSGPLMGTVLGGGDSMSERTVRLLLREPSYPAVVRIRQRLLERFGQEPPIAEAMSRGYLVLHTPDKYVDESEHFIQLVTHTYLESDPMYIDRRMRALLVMALEPDANLERLSLLWEAVGPTAVAYLQPLYSNENPRVRAYAARAGLRLEDVRALPVLVELATTLQNDVALMATEALGRCPYPQAAISLVPLLDSDDQRLRVVAYEALRRHRHSAIRTRVFRSLLDPMQMNFVLDVVTSNGPPLIYVRRAQSPRIVVFGPDLRARRPLFYSAPDDAITVNAVSATADVTVFAKRNGRLTDRLHVSPSVVDIITALGKLPTRDEAGQLRGLGLSYAQVVEVLAALCADGTVPARLYVERARTIDAEAPDRLPTRPETDESETEEIETPSEQPAGGQRSDTGPTP